DLWVASARAEPPRRLTFGAEDVRSPVVGPRDHWVYFLADDAQGRAQVHRVPLAGGATTQLTELAEGVSAFDLTTAEPALWLLSHEDGHGDDAWEHLRDAWSDLHYADRTITRSTISRVDLETWRQEPVWSPGRYI